MAKGKHTKLGDWQKRLKDGGVCKKCLRTYSYLTVEHIIPVYLLVQLGLSEEAYNDEDNFEELCKGCNALKGATIDVTHPRTIVLLKKYVAMAEEKYRIYFKNQIPVGLYSSIFPL